MLKKLSFDFLKDLAKNNTRDWFDEHRDDYQSTMEDFSGLNQNIIDALSKFDKSIAESNLQGKDCIPRLNRDLRFAKDKSPYKTYLYSIINQGGRKSGIPGYFIFIDPGKCYIGAGAFQPEPERLKKIRQEIDYNFEEWKDITTNENLLKAFPNGIVSNESLQKVPKGFDADSPAKDFLKMKGYFVQKHYPDSFFQSRDSLQTILDSFQACQTLINFVKGS